MPVWFITGASRGFGRELTASALAGGDSVVAAARDPEDVRSAFPDAGPALLPVRLDVTDPETVRQAVRRAVDELGRIDVLVNNAGYGLFGGVEEVSDAEVRALFDTNVFGLLTVTRAVLPVLRAQGSGLVLNVSSSAGFAAGDGRGPYGASKSAVEGLSEALRAELAPLGIRVRIVEPGSFRTDFLSGTSVRRAGTRIPAYDRTVGALLDAIGSGSGRQPGDPAKAAAAVRELASLADPPVRLQLGSDCVALVEAKLALVAGELDTWRDTAVSTDLST